MRFGGVNRLVSLTNIAKSSDPEFVKSFGSNRYHCLNCLYTQMKVVGTNYFHFHPIEKTDSVVHL
jgi:hypothetical protein